MAYIKESQSSRKLSYEAEKASTSREYHLVDYVDSQAALSALTAFVPQTILVGNYICSLPKFSISPVLDDPERTVFKGTVSWESQSADSGGGDDPQEPEDDTSFSFSFASIEDVKLYSSSQRTYQPRLMPRVGIIDGINQQHLDSIPEGMAVNKAIITITAKTVIAGNVATNAWFKDRLDQVWTLNDSTWRSLPAKSVAFTGMQGDKRSDGNWNITYNFEYRPDNEAQDFATEANGNPESIFVPATRGWEYVWAAWDKFTVEDGNEGEKRTKRVVRSVNVVEDVYPTSDFTQLGMVGV